MILDTLDYGIKALLISYIATMTTITSNGKRSTAWCPESLALYAVLEALIPRALPSGIVLLYCIQVGQ